MTRYIAALTFLCLPVQALAWSDLDRMTTAQALGSVLASEKLCGLSYNQDAIALWIEKSVPADDMAFASTLQLMVVGSETQNQNLGESGKAAHCAQISRVANAYNFTP